MSQGSERELRVHVTPLSLLDPMTGTLQVGLQKKLNRRIALSVDYGQQENIYGSHFGYHQDRKNYRYSKSRLELKCFLNLFNRDSLINVEPYYLSVEGMYFPQRYVKEDDWLLTVDNSYRYEYSNIRRTVWVGSLKLGKETRHSRIVFDRYIGIGIRKLEISHQPFGAVEEEYLPTPHAFTPADRSQGIFYRPHLALGVKAGYILK